MPPTNVGVIYSAGRKILRRIVVPDAEPSISDWQQYTAPQEKITLIPHSGDWSHAGCVQAIAHAENIENIPTGRCAVVDSSGNVARIILADIHLDSVDGFSLIESDLANTNDHYNVEIHNDFSRRYAVVDIPTSTVTSIAYLAITGAAPQDGGHFLINSNTLQVGDKIPPLSK
jgi:hypothetical protein